MWYKLDFKRLWWLMLPISLRKPVTMAFLEALAQPIVSLYYTWSQYRLDNIYKLNHTWQVCYMEGALNDRFDSQQRRIYIDGTGGDAEKKYIYTTPEDLPKYLGILYLNSKLEFADTGADFTVYVPKSIAQAQPYELRALIDFYKLGGKRYNIIEI